MIIMASLPQRRPSVSNWFSSLTRKPKKKASSLQDASKKFQRSCVDLSTNSTFYVTPSNKTSKKILETTTTTSSTLPPSSTSSSLYNNDAYKPANLNETTGASTINLQDEDDRRGLVTGKRVSRICSRCCCHISIQSRNNSPTKKKIPTSPPPPTVNVNSSPDFTTTVHTFSNTTLYETPVPETPPPQPTPLTATATAATTTTNTKVTTKSDFSRDVEISRLPQDPNQPNVQTFNKRTAFSHTKTTTTTQTLIISRPVELEINDRGEVVARRSPKPSAKSTKATRSNRLAYVLDNDDDCGVDGGVVGPRPLSPLETVAGEGGEFKFIDDSSTSPSENENCSQNSKNNNNNNNNNNDSIYNNKNICSRNNVSDLCDNCKNVIQLNRNNNAQNTVIMRNKQIKDELREVVSEMEALDVPEDCKHSNRDKQMSIGRKKFNMDPKKGIEYLVENRLLRHDPQDVAHFLHKGEGLNKTAIGDYLGEKNDFNEDVLKAFVALHDFTNLILVQALRQFLWSFRLPGEAQKIDRMMECFAQRYCQLNPDIFTNTDTCYVLSFAIIMLNTSLHNPSVKDKPTVEQFISMNRGINNGGDLPRGLLESLYDSIRTEPFKIPQDDGNDLMHTFFNPDKEGWLWKQGGRYKSWKRRWFILNDNCLYYFEYTTDKEPRGIIPLENISVREIHDRSKPHCFELFAAGGADIIKACKTDSEGKVVEGKHTVYRMSAATEEDQQEWIKRLTQSISHNPFYDILVQRKKKALSKS